MTKHKRKFKKLTASQKKIVRRSPSNWTQVSGSNTVFGGQSPMRSTSGDPRHPVKPDTIK